MATHLDTDIDQVPVLALRGAVVALAVSALGSASPSNQIKTPLHIISLTRLLLRDRSWASVEHHGRGYEAATRSHWQRCGTFPSPSSKLRKRVIMPTRGWERQSKDDHRDGSNLEARWHTNTKPAELRAPQCYRYSKTPVT
jgi:hypothetical protein